MHDAMRMQWVQERETDYADRNWITPKAPYQYRHRKHIGEFSLYAHISECLCPPEPHDDHLHLVSHLPEFNHFNYDFLELLGRGR